jgi:hypothetical protein
VHVTAGWLTVCVLQVPDQPRKILCLPIDIPSKFFPLILFALFSLLSGFSVGSLVAMVFGYLYGGTALLEFLKPTSHYFEALEAAGFWHRVSRAPGWALAATLGHDAYVAVNTVDREPLVGNSGGGGSSSGQNRRSTSSGGTLGGGGGGGGKARVYGFNDLPPASENGPEDDKKEAVASVRAVCVVLDLSLFEASVATARVHINVSVFIDICNVVHCTDPLRRSTVLIHCR